MKVRELIERLCEAQEGSAADTKVQIHLGRADAQGNYEYAEAEALGVFVVSHVGSAHKSIVIQGQ